MTIRPFTSLDHPELLRLQVTLFPHSKPEEHEAEWRGHGMTGNLGGVPGCMFVIDRGDGKLGGFVEVSLRNIADGCLSTPVGYLEAWYVDADLRQQGWGKRLVAAAEEWALMQGCTEMASDCLIENEISLRGHLKMGYGELNRCIHFVKNLPVAAAVLAASSGDGAAETAAATENWIGLFATPLTISRSIEFVTDARAGGIDVFLGTTRAEKSPDGRDLLALDYEAYEQMALEQMRALAKRVREKWPIVKLALLHRTGLVRLGEPSVVIAVSTPHRAQAFEACRFLIDDLKRDIAIWKKEVWADETARWVHPGNRGEGQGARGEEEGG